MTVTVATYNAPHRLLHKGLPDDFQRLADRGCDIIVAQEQTDHDPVVCVPRGWSYHRPQRARHNVVYWNPDTVDARKRGAVKVSTPGVGTGLLRYIVWTHFRTEQGPLRVGGIHLPAFKTSRPRNAVEFRRQEARMAEWMDSGPFRVMAGDFNARIPSRVWTRRLTRVGRWSRQVVSGPHRAKIDYVGANADGPWQVAHTETMRGASDHHAVIATLAHR